MSQSSHTYSAYQCPLCQQPLLENAHQLCCSNRHSFDRAKEGYFNLLPVQHKRSKEPGDSKAMMQARRDFLEAGHYQPLADALKQAISALGHEPSARLLDIGCGEGFYTQQLSVAHQTYGLDIAKVAIRYAAKRYHNVQFCVASTQRLPYGDQSMDVIVKIYAPCEPSELKRVLKPGGTLITVTPGPRHLYQLKAYVYGDVRLHDAQAPALEGFDCVTTQSLHYPMTLSANETTALLQMTPFAWRAKPPVWQQISEIPIHQIEADFLIAHYQAALA
ncbi:23S rRNA (guanine(745)-N(1))-methyltransferase [Vibrio stylophorae]|uniref:23S rRNA (Guanine(745)-N(1))-methyltransferase n=1 Tax=Vibrio stylophorae TaxID=659351 RepID=A0ABM8ZUG6_9VIBR|nr:23S rRNA (guanine(745)-N(1))-methyltransferase [Vibrio stylophorae]CAH0533962.1 23S rRNA (guanine(745)-N(1))-methyltransferase [Vibrio stylophorae]